VGAEVLELDSGSDFTAARARDAGFHWVRERHPEIEFIQFVDGDCRLMPGWLATAVTTLDADPGLGAVWGLLREVGREHSVFHRICDMEWSLPPPGDVDHFGGVVMIRLVALLDSGGYDPFVTASEDHELSLRMRAARWRIRRCDTLMALHNSRMNHPRQWWTRNVRFGTGCAQILGRHGVGRDRAGRKHAIRITTWAALTPALLIALAPATSGVSLLAFAIYPARTLRIALREIRLGRSVFDAALWGTHCVAGSFPAFWGMLRYAFKRAMGVRAGLIEYRKPSQPND
jgi:hypothetical protein